MTYQFICATECQIKCLNPYIISKQWPLAPNSPKWRITRANVSNANAFGECRRVRRVLEFDKFAGEWPLLNNFSSRIKPLGYHLQLVVWSRADTTPRCSTQVFDKPKLIIQSTIIPSKNYSNAPMSNLRICYLHNRLPLNTQYSINRRPFIEYSL